MARTKTTARTTTKKATTKKAVVASSGSKGSSSKKGLTTKTYTRIKKDGSKYQVTMYFLNGKLTGNPNAPKKSPKKPGKARNPETLKAALGNRLIKASTFGGKQSGTGAMVWAAFEKLVHILAQRIMEKVKAANDKPKTKKEKTASYAYFASAAKAHLKTASMEGDVDELILPAATTFVPATGIASGKYRGEEVGLIISGPAFEAVIAESDLGKLNARSRKPMQYFCEQLIIRELDKLNSDRKTVRLTREELAETFGVKDVGGAPSKGRKGPPKMKGMTKKEIVDGLMEIDVGMARSTLMKMTLDDLRELDPRQKAKNVTGRKKVKKAGKKVAARKKVKAVAEKKVPQRTGKGKKKVAAREEVEDSDDEESFVDKGESTSDSDEGEEY